jgi:uncharacterized peroxidase-related enzyme
MRLHESERGDTFRTRTLIGLISMVSGIRLPDAARVAFYHRDFLGGALSEWTQKTLRGPSEWSISERELMAAMVARWNACPFCVGAHRAVAIKGIPKAVADAVIADFESADIGDGLKAVLRFLEAMTRTPQALTGESAAEVLRAGVSPAALEDAIAVGAIFNIIARYANALGFAIPSEAEFDKAADMLLKRGYGG